MKRRESMRKGVLSLGEIAFRSLLSIAGLSAIAISAQAQMPPTPTQGTVTAAPVAAAQPLGPKAPGKIRIGVAPAQAQVGQGSNAQGDYGTPIRNSIVLIMSGPAVEVVGLDARLPIQVQAEAQEKQCDYILYSTV